MQINSNGIVTETECKTHLFKQEKCELCGYEGEPREGDCGIITRDEFLSELMKGTCEKI